MKMMMGMVVCGLVGASMAHWRTVSDPSLGLRVRGVRYEQQAPQEAPKPAEEKPAAAKASADVVKTNPVKATAESIASGKKAYGTDCAMCHGKTGAGDGDLAVDMKLKLKDYRDPVTLKDMSDGEMYTIILNGKGQMTGEEGRLKEQQIWSVVNYVRSLAKSKT
jgi:mono/diheme cytochrome c family protein